MQKEILSKDYLKKLEIKFEGNKVSAKLFALISIIVSSSIYIALFLSGFERYTLVFFTPIVSVLIAAFFYNRLTYIALTIYFNILILIVQPQGESQDQYLLLLMIVFNFLLILICEFLITFAEKRTLTEKTLILKSNIITSISLIYNSFIRSENINGLFLEIPELIGNSAGFENVFLYRNVDEKKFELVKDWFKPEFKESLKNLKSINLEGNPFSLKLQTLYKPVYIDVSKLEVKFADQLGVKPPYHLIINPITVETKLWGILIVGETDLGYEMIEIYKNSLFLISSFIGSIIEKEQSYENIKNKTIELEKLNNMMLNRELKIAELKEKLNER